jgi:HK97 gp10 family phage protein
VSSDFDRQIDSLSPKIRRRLAKVVKEQAGLLAEGIREAAPQGESGLLKQSVRVEDGRNELEAIVTAGGELTTRPVRSGAAATYDYALGVEFGNEHAPAQPFFFSTYAEMRDDIRQTISDEVAEALNE